LASATTAAEILDARDQATLAYDAAKAATRFAKAKNAHDQVIAACHRAQAYALDIKAQTLCRLAEEYDAAQERGEIAKQNTGRPKSVPNKDTYAKTDDLGFPRKQMHEARKILYAEKAKPGVVRKALDQQVEAGEGSTWAHVMRAAEQTLHPKEKQQHGAPKGTKQQASAPNAPKARTSDTTDDRAALKARIVEFETANREFATRNRELEARVDELVGKLHDACRAFAATRGTLQTVLALRGDGPLTGKEFNLIRSFVAPDHLNNMGIDDPKEIKRANEVLALLNDHKEVLVRKQDHEMISEPVPKFTDVGDLDRLRRYAKQQNRRAAKKAAKSPPITPRRLGDGQ
jgi:hypothetical protein